MTTPGTSSPPSAPASLTAAQAALQRQVRATPELRRHLMVLAQTGSEDHAFDAVLATLYGAELARPSGVNVPELLAWTARALKFRARPPEPDRWTPGDPVNVEARLNALPGAARVRHYGPEHPLHAAVLTGLLLSAGLERSETLRQGVDAYVAAYRAYSFAAGYAGQVTPWIRSQPRDRPALSAGRQLIDLEVGVSTGLHGARHGTLDTSFAAVFRYTDTGARQLGVFDWPLTGPAQDLSVATDLGTLLGVRAFRRQWNPRAGANLPGNATGSDPGFDAAALDRLLNRQAR